MVHGALMMMVVFIVVWTSIIVYWRMSETVPSGTQMLFFLAVLPFAIVLVWWWYRRYKRKKNPIIAGSAAASVAAQAEASEIPDYQVEIVAAAVQLPVGDDAKTILDRMDDLPRPGLHPKLRDRNGFPVFASFVEDLESKTSELSFKKFSDAANDEQLRAIALLEPIVDQLFEKALTQMPSLPVVEERIVAGLKRTIEQEDSDILHVTLLLPLRWGHDLLDASVSWLRERALATGLDEKRLHLEAVLAREPEDIWFLVDRLGFTESDGGRRQWHLLLGCESLISQVSFECLRGMEQSMAGEMLPLGEGAAGMLLKRLGSGETPVAESPVLLHRIMTKTMDQNISTRGASRVLSELIVQSLSASKIDAETITYVISDAAQQHSGQIVETGAGVMAVCPDLDVSSQCCAVGSVTGYIGHVAPLVVLGLAYAKTEDSRQPVLALGIIGNQERVALVISSTVSLPEAAPAAAG